MEAVELANAQALTAMISAALAAAMKRLRPTIRILTQGTPSVQVVSNLVPPADCASSTVPQAWDVKLPIGRPAIFTDFLRSREYLDWFPAARVRTSALDPWGASTAG